MEIKGSGLGSGLHIHDDVMDALHIVYTPFMEGGGSPKIYIFLGWGLFLVDILCHISLQHNWCYNHCCELGNSQYSFVFNKNINNG